MIYCFTANNRTHFFLHVGVLSLFINNGTELSAFASICPFLAFLRQNDLHSLEWSHYCNGHISGSPVEHQGSKEKRTRRRYYYRYGLVGNSDWTPRRAALLCVI